MLAKHKFVLALPLLAISLNSCGVNGWKEVDFETYKAAVNKASEEKAPEISSFTVNGTIKSDEGATAQNLEFKDYKVDPNSIAILLDTKALAITLIISLLPATMFTSPEAKLEDVDAPVHFFTGKEGFKVHAKDEENEATVTWNTHCYLTSMSDGGKGDINFTIAYEYKDSK